MRVQTLFSYLPTYIVWLEINDALISLGNNAPNVLSTILKDLFYFSTPVRPLFPLLQTKYLVIWYVLDKIFWHGLCLSDDHNFFQSDTIGSTYIPITYTQCMTLYCTLRTTQTTGEADTHCIVCVQCMAMHSTHLMYKLLMLLPGRNSRI